MLDIALFIILAMGLLVGLKRGFILQFIHLTGFIIAYIVAYKYFGVLAPKLELWVPYPSFGESGSAISFFTGGNLEDAYYRAVAFVILFIGTKILLQVVGSMLDFVTYLPVLKQLNKWAGAILGFLEIYLILFILLFIGGLLPIPEVQSAMGNSGLAKVIVHHTPYFSDKVQELWLQYAPN
ncbi:CvpA family protein [Metabacillus idriensis]|uniref:CvpA family protein n=1 Tax=Metabacillus idriensis TaxID=324768 RepID=UPI0008A95EF8|nr:CvpA family protein [Metabacillus idriensis]MCM3596463.1 CvpA family protein [Metabacillus idriensis]OHR68367.1 hypothetical protein HMPREF3291_09085 [Bacillus sp. HMSC76G11]